MDVVVLALNSEKALLLVHVAMYVTGRTVYVKSGCVNTVCKLNGAMRGIILMCRDNIH